MKIKLALLAILPLLLLQTGCQNSSSCQNGSCVHGSAGVSAQSANTSQVAPKRGN